MKLRFWLAALVLALMTGPAGPAQAAITTTTTLPGNPTLTCISVFPQALTTSATTITIPAGTKRIYIAPAGSNTNTITLKGVSGDTGIALSRNTESLIYLDQTALPANFVLVAGASITVTIAFTST